MLAEEARHVAGDKADRGTLILRFNYLPSYSQHLLLQSINVSDEDTQQICVAVGGRLV